MTRVYTTDAIILRNKPYQDYNRLVVCFTRDFGKITCIARGVYKSESRLAGHLLVARVASISFVFGRQFPVLIDASRTYSTLETCSSWVWLAHAIEASRLIDCALMASETHKPLYEALDAGFRLLRRESFTQKEHIHSFAAMLLGYVTLQLLSHLGHAPELENCTRCGLEAEGDELYLSMKEGGILHKRCLGSNGAPEHSLPRHIFDAMRLCIKKKHLPPYALKNGEAFLFRDISYMFFSYVHGEHVRKRLISGKINNV